MVEKQVELVDDIITFFQKFGASNELSNRNFDTGDFFSEEYCNFVLDLAKKYGLYDDFKLKYDFHALKVIQYDINGNKLKEFPSLTDAAEFVGLTGTSSIAKCCKGKRRSAGGYLWRYKE